MASVGTDTVIPMSRKGYALKDLARSFLQVLGEAGTVATGKLLHFTADLLSSDGPMYGSFSAGTTRFSTSALPIHGFLCT